jgi:hypothetical protein
MNSQEMKFRRRSDMRRFCKAFIGGNSGPANDGVFEMRRLG